jgi:hypothetical protein
MICHGTQSQQLHITLTSYARGLSVRAIVHMYGVQRREKHQSTLSIPIIAGDATGRINRAVVIHVQLVWFCGPVRSTISVSRFVATWRYLCYRLFL